MKANRKKLMLAMARACMDTEDLQKAAEMPRPTLNNAICGKSVRPCLSGGIGRTNATQKERKRDEIRQDKRNQKPA